MARLLLLVAVTLVASALPLVPTAAAENPCEDVRDATGVATCWPVWHAQCVERSTPKTVARCFEGAEPHVP